MGTMIGDSGAAPRINVVRKPNEWEATVDEAKDAGSKEETRQDQFPWMRPRLKSFDRVFRPLLSRM